MHRYAHAQLSIGSAHHDGSSVSTEFAKPSSLGSFGQGFEPAAHVRRRAFDMAAPPRESTAKLRGELVNNGAADDAESRAVIGALVKLVAPAGHPAGSASTGIASQLAGGTPSKPEDDDANTLECYRDAKVLQSLEVELDEMLVTTGQMRRDVLKYGYIT